MRNLIKTKATKKKQLVFIYPGNKQKRKGFTNMEIGAFHQEGGKNLPKREWFGISAKAEKDCVTLIEKTIDRLLKRA